jgi:hypothetical protein
MEIYIDELIAPLFALNPLVIHEDRSRFECALPPLSTPVVIHEDRTRFECALPPPLTPVVIHVINPVKHKSSH